MEFGECAMSLKAKSGGKNERLGFIREASCEHIVGTTEGVVKARTVRRREVEEDKWNKELFNQFQGTPWKPVPGRSGDELRVRVSIPDTRPVEAPPRPSQEEAARRGVIITKEMVNKYGFTSRCAGCQAINRGVAKQPHTEKCRQRVEDKLRGEGKPNLLRAEERTTDQLA